MLDNLCYQRVIVNNNNTHSYQFNESTNHFTAHHKVRDRNFVKTEDLTKFLDSVHHKYILTQKYEADIKK